MFRKLVKDAFGIRDGEIRISLFMQLYIFLIITVLLIVKPTISALFLKELGADNLPYGFLLVALVAVLSSYFYNKALRRFTLRKVIISTLLFFSASFALLSIVLSFSFYNESILYAYYVIISLFAVLTASQFWILANLIYTSREAKRLFGFIGTGAIAGGIFGGYLTTLLSPLIGNRFLILIAALLIISCIPLVQIIWKSRLRQLTISIKNQNRKKIRTPAFRLILGSKHLMYLAGIVGVSVIIAKLVDFQFSDFASTMISDADKLASFFGFWFSTFNVFSLGLQLFLTNRIVNYFGVTSTMLFLPLGIAAGCLLFLVAPELGVMVLIKGIDGSFKQSINKAATELIVVPVPSEIKNTAKSYIDIVVDSIATGIAGFLLIFLIKGFNLSIGYVTIITLVFLFIWLVLIFKIRESYFLSFRENLKVAISRTPSLLNDVRRESGLKTAVKVLDSGTPLEVIRMLDQLSNVDLKQLKNNIIGLLSHTDPKVQVAAIQELYRFDSGTAITKVKALITQGHPVVITIAMQYVIHHSNYSERSIFQEYLNHKDSTVADAALVCLSMESITDKDIARKFELENRIDQRFASLNRATTVLDAVMIKNLLMVVGYTAIPKYYSFITYYMKSTEKSIVKSAIRAAGNTHDFFFLEMLLDFLEMKVYRRSAKKALVKMGAKLPEILFAMDKEEKLKDPVRQHIPLVIQHFKTQNSVRTLLRLLQSKDAIIRLEAARSLVFLQRRIPELKYYPRVIYRQLLKEITLYQKTLRNGLRVVKYQSTQQPMHTREISIDDQVEASISEKLVIELIDKRLNYSFETIFKLLGMRHNAKDIEMTYLGIMSSNRNTRSNAIEFLDTMVSSKIKDKLFPIVEKYLPNPIQSMEDSSISEEVDTAAYYNSLKILMKNHGKRLKIAILRMLYYIDHENVSRIAKKYESHQNDEVKENAVKILTLVRS